MYRTTINGSELIWVWKGGSMVMERSRVIFAQINNFDYEKFAILMLLSFVKVLHQS